MQAVCIDAANGCRGVVGLLIVRVLMTTMLVILASALAGCASLGMRNAVPNAVAAERASLPNLPGVRAWADEVPASVPAEIRRRLPSLPMLARESRRVAGRPVVEILALSGGGGDGAFGAGLLAGWTANGTRPTFELVTGVSAGAIIAPFAFLGPRHDRTLREIWTRYETSQIITAQILPGLLGGSALADTGPLQQLISKYVDKRLLAEIAREYRRGRILLVGTTNIDAQRPVVWNMGEIAASRHPDALELFKKVILASAAIPGAFPPVNIEVRVDGKIYEEMHIDGGTTREIFISPIEAPLKAFDGLYDQPPIRRIYIIKNGKLTPEYDAVPQQTIPISLRAIYTLIKAQSQGDIYKVWRMSRDAGADFNLAAVPATFNVKPTQAFDPAYQSALYEEGFRLGKSGNPWRKTPPVKRSAARPAR